MNKYENPPPGPSSPPTALRGVREAAVLLSPHVWAGKSGGGRGPGPGRPPRPSGPQGFGRCLRAGPGQRAGAARTAGRRRAGTAGPGSPADPRRRARRTQAALRFSPGSLKTRAMTSWGVPYSELTEKEKTRAWFTDGSA
ncbi:uncharacterized protein LOC143664335 [Tamandua tetradactyla]|uniref:uncharacterized protein LOC143664335 n=1 Tax=Tamandua tetradactyla TaxID=48850 RepID=UPI00405460C0